MEYLDGWMSWWRVCLPLFLDFDFDFILFLQYLAMMLTCDRSPEDVVRRLDALIQDIRNKYQQPCFEDPEETKGDVLIVAHGHILRAFAMRWTGKPLTETSLILEAGGIGTLRYEPSSLLCFRQIYGCLWCIWLTKCSYEHHNIDEPAIILGGQFVVE